LNKDTPGENRARWVRKQNGGVLTQRDLDQEIEALPMVVVGKIKIKHLIWRLLRIHTKFREQQWNRIESTY